MVIGMACEYCRYDRGHHPQCPEADEPRIITYCLECKEAIREGDEYYHIGDQTYCEECMETFKKYAEYDEWDDR
jgi:hypothetical protein